MATLTGYQVREAKRVQLDSIVAAYDNGAYLAGGDRWARATRRENARRVAVAAAKGARIS